MDKKLKSNCKSDQTANLWTCTTPKHIDQSNKVCRYVFALPNVSKRLCRGRSTICTRNFSSGDAFSREWKKTDKFKLSAGYFVVTPDDKKLSNGTV